MPLTKKKVKDDEQSIASETKQPIKNVPALMGEGEKFYRDQLYTKAIQCYTEVLELSPGNTNALVERSACYLKTGRNDLALADAEESLKEDRKFTKGLYQKAEALYAMGEFELALVFYHRGKKLRGDVKEFQLGINKAQEAIDNCVGDPNTVKLEVKGDLSYFERPDEKPKKKTGGYVKPSTQKAIFVQKREKRPVKPGSQKTIKQLLGELYADKVYLEHLLEDDRTTKANTKSGDAIWSLANNGLDYLDSRTEFWRQQKPIYARRKYNAAAATSGGADSVRNPLNYIIKQLETIDNLQTQGQHQESLKKSNKLMVYLNKANPSQVTDKKPIEANIFSYIGNAQLEMGNYPDALEAHQKDLDISTSIEQTEGISRALENIGRVYARCGKYNQAIEVWEKKTAYLGDNDLEKAWLYHEIGRCYLETGKYDMSKSYGQRSLEMAEKINDDTWKRNATILIAQCEARIGDEENLKLAIGNFEKALEYSEKQEDTGGSRAIKAALADCKEKLKKLQGSTPRSDSDKKEAVVTSTASQPKPKEAEKPKVTEPKPPMDYEVQVKTCDEMGAGTDANVFLSLFGDAGELIDLSLRNESSDGFEKDKLDSFSFKKLTDVGKLKKIKIGHDGLKSGSSWKLEFVKISFNNTIYTFEANRWIDSDFKKDSEKYTSIELEPSSVVDVPKEKKSVVDEAQNKQKPAKKASVDSNNNRKLIDYEVQVKTSDEMSAGTDANVFVVLFGDKGELNLELRSPEPNAFEKNSTDVFLLDKLADIGKLKKIKIGHDGQSKGSSWKLDSVKVFFNNSVYNFKANRWLDIENKSASEKYVSVELEPSSVESNLTRYEVHVKTADESGAGTDSNVFLSVKASGGELVAIDLKQHITSKNKNPFEQDQLDKFVFYMKDVGKVQKLIVWHDNKGFGASWKLDNIKLITNGSTFAFNANKWIEKDKLELSPS